MNNVTAKDVIARIDGAAPNTTAGVRHARREISKHLKAMDRALILRLALDVIRSRHSYGRFVAYELVQHHEAAMQGLTPAEVERLGEGMSDWAAVDTFACYISGPAWREGRIADGRVHLWAQSKDRWWRRAALVSTVPLNVRSQGGDGDPRRTLAVCARLLDDRDEMIVKAMSWALRALAVRDAAAVSAFIVDYDDRLAALVKREVRNKLATGLKNRPPKPARSPS